MDQRTNYLLQILETIGSPLMGAITRTAPEGDEGHAQSMAALLGKTIEASIELGNIMDINPAEAQDDTLRVALAGLAGPLVAGQFSKRGQAPESPDIKKVTGALQAVLTFSDNFTPTPETIERLKNLEASGQVVDNYQTQIQYMQAFIPVIEAISAFPFGQAEAKLIMDVSDRLVKKSVELREALLPGVGDEGAQKRVELGFLRALAMLYSACHKAETDKYMNMDENERAAGLSIEPVWAAFDVRTAMLEALVNQIVPGNDQPAVSSGTQAPAVASPPPVNPVAETPPAAPVEPPPASPPATPPEQPQQPPAVQTPPPAEQPPAAQAASQAPAGQNPMSMFAKPKTDAPSEPSQPPPPATPASPPPTEQVPPSVVPPAAPPTPPPAQEPPAHAPLQSDEGAQGGDDGGGQAGGSPMSFFKKGDG